MGHLERECPARRLKHSALAAPPPIATAAASPAACRPAAPPPPSGQAPSYSAAVVVSSQDRGAVLPMAAVDMTGAAYRRLATSTCAVVSTLAMEEESYRLRTTALLLTASGPCSGISADMVVEVVEHDHGFPRRDIDLAPCFPEDFLLVLSDRRQRDLVFERRQVVVAGVKFLLRPWFPPPGGNRVWRFYCRVAIDRLPLNAWDWDNVQEVIGKQCKLDLIERQSTTKTNRTALFAWPWTWDPDLIPRASDFNFISRPDVARPRGSLPEGTPLEEGKEGPHFPVLIHLDVVKDYTPVDDEDQEWPRTYKHKGWRMGVKDGEGRTRAVVPANSFRTGRRDDGADDGHSGGGRRRGKRSGARAGFWQGVRDRAHCRDTASRDLEPRRYRRHEACQSAVSPAACLTTVRHEVGPLADEERIMQA
ncbi:uncharacterized protein LOC119281108 [Triticum dicoccoides]|uniref:uncharacterized protein LOC119281108 n=1 Tax=Triticum dicoccoides TaxID=85692 RepID=UPI000E7A5099|nr:uncharacterized protein LOC119281108 [Triticum dicoccoides]